MGRKRGTTTASVTSLTKGKEGKVATAAMATDMSMHVDKNSVPSMDLRPTTNANTIQSKSRGKDRDMHEKKDKHGEETEKKGQDKKSEKKMTGAPFAAERMRDASVAGSKPYAESKTGKTTLHRCRFVEWTPEAINAMSMAPVGCRPILALVRANGDVELRDAAQNWSPLHIPTGGAIGRSIETVLWTGVETVDRVREEREKEAPAPNVSSLSNSEMVCGALDPRQTAAPMGREGGERKQRPLSLALSSPLPLGRLFTAGHDGMLVEWDPLQLIPRQHLELNAGGLWALAGGEGRHLAVACENGTIKVVKFSSSDGSHESGRGLSLVKTIPVVLAEGDSEERILSLAWAPFSSSGSRPKSSSDRVGRLLAAGTSAGTLILIDWPTGRVLHRIHVDSTTIWSLKFINDHLLVMGSARGMVRLWDCTLGVLLSSHSTGHKHADVLSLAVSPDHTRIFASSSDGRTLALGLADDHKWVKLETFSMHKHDVRSSLCAILPGDPQKVLLLTAGTSGEVAMRGTDDEKARTKYLGMISKPLITMAPLGRLLVAASQPGRLDFWTLGQVSSSTLMATEHLRVPGRFLLRMNIPHGESVSSFDISADGRTFGYCTRSTLRLYQLTIDDGMTMSGQEKANDLILEGTPSPSHVHLAKINIILPPPYGSQYGSLQALALSPDGSSLAVALKSPSQSDGFHLYLFKLARGNSAKLVADHHLTTSSSPLAAINFLRFSEDGSKLALIDIMGAVHLFSASISAGLQLMASHTLPSRVTAARFVPGTENYLLLATADRRLSLLTMGGRSGPSSIRSPSRLPHPWLYHHSDIITGIAFAPATVEDSPGEAINRVRLFSETTLVECSLGDLLAEGANSMNKDGRGRKRRRQKSAAEVKAGQNDLGTPHMRLHAEYGKILFFDYLSHPSSSPSGPGSGAHREAVLIERPLEHIHLSLPPAQDRKQFGGF